MIKLWPRNFWDLPRMTPFTLAPFNNTLGTAFVEAINKLRTQSR